MKLLMGLAMGKAALDIAGAATYLHNHVDVSGRGLGAVAFCMGGSLAPWNATLSLEVIAAVGFYPGLPWARMAPAWKNYSGKKAINHRNGRLHSCGLCFLNLD